MRYGKIVGDAWRALWRAWAMWGVLAIGYLVVGTIVAAAFAITAVSGLALYLEDPFDVSGGAILAVLGMFALAAVASAIVYWVFHGGLVYLSNEALEGRPTKFAAAWAVGFRRLGSLLGFEITLGLVIGTAYAVGGSLLFLAFGGIMTLAGLNEGDAWAGGTGLTGICCAYAVFMAVLFLVATLVTGFEAVGARSVVIGSRGAMAALGEAWSILTRRFKHLFVMGLLMLGIQWAYGFAASIVLTPLQFLFMPDFILDVGGTVPPDPETIITSFGTFYGVYGVATMLLMLPMVLFGYLAWTGFFRQVVGLDAPPAEPVWAAPAPAGMPPVPPSAPEAPAWQVPPPPEAPRHGAGDGVSSPAE